MINQVKNSGILKEIWIQWAPKVQGIRGYTEKTGEDRKKTWKTGENRREPDL
jgi:hypothetical protein